MDKLLHMATQKDHVRAFCRHPFNCSTGTYATDGHILIWVDDRYFNVKKYDDVEHPDDGNIFRMLIGGERKGFISLVDLNDCVLRIRPADKQGCMDIAGVYLSREYANKAKNIMVCLGASYAEVRKKTDNISFSLTNEEGAIVACVSVMGIMRNNAEVVCTATLKDSGNTDVDEAYGDIYMAQYESEKEASIQKKLESRTLFLVSMHKVAYLPVYASSAEEAEEIAKRADFDDYELFDESDTYPGPYVPEESSQLECEDCYDSVFTEDGEMTWDEFEEKFGDNDDENEED